MLSLTTIAASARRHPAHQPHPIVVLLLLAMLLSGGPLPSLSAPDTSQSSPAAALHGDVPAPASASARIIVPATLQPPQIDGRCAADEYRSAAVVDPAPTNGSAPVVRLLHTARDLYICFDRVPIAGSPTPNNHSVQVLISRAVLSASAPGIDDLRFGVSSDGSAFTARGDGTGFSRRAASDYGVATRHQRGAWSAEWRIGAGALGGTLLNRDIGIALGSDARLFGLHASWLGWPANARWNTPASWGIAHLAGSAPHTSLDLRPTAIEVTQTIQNLDNSVVLVAGKRTFARVYATATQPIALEAASGARLLATTADGQRLPEVLLPIGTAPVQPGTLLDRLRLDRSFVFELPRTWIGAGTLSLTAVLDPHQMIAETDETNNRATVGPLVFTPAPPLHLRVVPYDVLDAADQRLSVTPDQIAATESLLRRTLPIAMLDIQHLPPLLDTAAHSGDMQRALQQIALRYPAAPGVLTLGLMPTYGGMTWSLYPGVAISMPGETAVHEVGHLLGMYHLRGDSSCLLPDHVAPFPYPDGIIGGPAGNTACFCGIDAGDAGLSDPAPLRVIPGSTPDMMTYCADRWLSDSTYNQLHAAIEQVSAAASAAAPQASTPAQPHHGPALTINGTLDRADEQVLIDSVTYRADASESPASASGTYHIRLLDRDDRLLLDHPFSPRPVSAGDSFQLIRERVPLVAGTRRIAIVSDRSGYERASVPISAHVPTVAITSPPIDASISASGPITLTWHASDADGDPLRFSVLYRAAATQPWLPLITGLTATGATIDRALLPGSSAANDGQFRVEASDGLLIATADSAPFAVASQPPAVRIAQPANRSQFLIGQTVTLEAVAIDPEDGTLNDAALVWTSDRDGLIGSGHLLHTQRLSIGTHVLSLTATDASGLVARATVTVTIDDDT